MQNLPKSENESCALFSHRLKTTQPPCRNIFTYPSVYETWPFPKSIQVRETAVAGCVLTRRRPGYGDFSGGDQPGPIAGRMAGLSFWLGGVFLNLRKIWYRKRNRGGLISRPWMRQASLKLPLRNRILIPLDPVKSGSPIPYP